MLYSGYLRIGSGLLVLEGGDRLDVELESAFLFTITIHPTHHRTEPHRQRHLAFLQSVSRVRLFIAPAGAKKDMAIVMG